MPNVFANVPVAAGTATGASVNTTALDDTKTIILTGSFSGCITVETSDDNTNFAPLASFYNPEVRTIQAACRFIRCRSTGVGGTPDLDIGAEQSGAVSVTPAVPAGNGSGAASDISTMGAEKQVIVTGAFTAAVNIEISQDNTNFGPLCSFYEPGVQNFVCVAQYVRVRISGYSGGTPVVMVAGTSDVTATALDAAVADADGLAPELCIRKAFIAAGPGVADDVVIYNANAPFAFRILESEAYVATNIGGSTLTLRSALAGAGSALSDAWNSATTGIKENTALTATPTVAAGGTLVVRRSDNGVAGEVVLFIQRT